MRVVRPVEALRHMFQGNNVFNRVFRRLRVFRADTVVGPYSVLFNIYAQLHSHRLITPAGW